jgi:hypothetical protein
MDAPIYPLITRDPIGGGELLVTRFESPTSQVVIEGRFSLGWIGRLTPEQLAFVGLLAMNRGNLQKVAADIGVSYNTARNRMDDIAAALGATAPEPMPAPPAAPQATPAHTDTLDRLAAGELTFEEALRKISG